MKAVARLRHLGVPALKVRRYARTIKGKDAMRAVSILDLQPSPTCQSLAKLLRSAIANAQNNLELAPESLEVSNVMVDQGPTMKRIRPRARGRAYRVLKRSCHVTIELDLKKSLRDKAVKSAADAEPAKQPAKAKPAAKKAAAKPAAKKPAASAAKQTTKSKSEGKAAESKAKPKTAAKSKPAAKSAAKPRDAAKAKPAKKSKEKE